MRSRSVRWALCAVLLVQLALGMPASFAMQHCPDHPMDLDSAGVSPHSHQASSSRPHPPLNHGCCHGSACQCHCTYQPAVSEQPALTGPIAVFMHRLPASPAPLVAAPPSERFRPPIA